MRHCHLEDVDGGEAEFQAYRQAHRVFTAVVEWSAAVLSGAALYSVACWLGIF